MKKIVIFMNCHGYEINKYLCNSKYLLVNYQINVISILHYVLEGFKYYENKSLDKNDINLIKDADILILQVIENNRGFLNNCEVIKYCKTNCNIIKIPHYRNSIYEYRCIENKNNKYDLIKTWNLPNKINDVYNINETKKIIQNEIDIMNSYKYDHDDMINSMKFKINEFKKIDDLSDIKMLDFYNNNFKKYRLFMGRGYPSSRFFFELTNRILIKLNYEPNQKFIDYYFAQNTSEPIPDYWYKFCNFTFDNTYFVDKNIKITENEWYHILLLSNNVNTFNSDNLKYLSIIRK